MKGISGAPPNSTGYIGDMKTIAILTDFGLDDNFVGVMKGVILGINPYVNLVDITHSIEPQNIRQAAFLLKTSFRYFPAGTIFLVVVDPGVGSERNALVVRTKNYFFVSPDNGVLSPAVNNDGRREIIRITNERYFIKPVSTTFHGRDIFSPVAAYLSKGENIKNFGPQIKIMKKLIIPEPTPGKNTLRGEVIYIDRFGNLVSNIERKHLGLGQSGKNIAIEINNKSINSISGAYHEIGPGKPLAIFGSSGFLEISVDCGSAQKYFRAKAGDKVKLLKK